MLLEDRIQKECAPCENELRPTPAVSEMCTKFNIQHNIQILCFCVLLISALQTSHQISICLSK